MDARTDIFSFGALLYEMVTGRRAFQGDSKMSTLAAVLQKEPRPLSEITRGVPAEVDRLIQRCLRKNPEKRWQTMADLKVALEELREESDSGKLVAASPVAAASRLRKLLSISAAGLLLAGALAAFAVWRNGSDKAPAQALRQIELTTYSGAERSPHLSPDGRQVAYIQEDESGRSSDVYVKILDAGEPLQLTRTPELERHPKWSPDGRQIAFMRQGAIYSIAPLGGAERKIAESVVGWFDWRPDGKAMVIAEPTGLYLLLLDTGERKQLTRSPANKIDWAPRFSMDGKRVAFVRDRTAIGQMDILAVATDGGEPVPVVVQEGFNHNPVFSAGGREVIFSRQWSALFRVPASGGTPAIIPGSEAGVDPFVHWSSNRLIYSRWDLDMNIWASETRAGARPQRVIGSTRRDFSVQVSPEGGRLAFTSDRTGNWELWKSGRNGTAQTQLTFFGNAIVDGARWSPDGTNIVFAALIAGNRDIYAISADGGTPQRLMSDPSDEGRPSDGKTIYFRSNRGGDPDVWKMSATGGAPRQVTRGGGFDAHEAFHGRTLFFARQRQTSGLWSWSPDTGESRPVRGLERVRAGGWAVTEAGIFWIDLPEQGRYLLMRWDPRTGANERRLAFEASIWPVSPVLSVSLDGKEAFWHQDDSRGANLMMIENFH